MDPSILFGGSLVAAFIAGVIALFAPCCISVMLPAYFAGTFQNRRMLLAMTLLFAAGVGTVILPLVLGASFLIGLFTTHHSLIYVIGGIFLMALALFVFAGGQLHLPMPGRSANKKTGPLSIYSLGIFSGVASSCCAPVLAGVIALSSFASSFGLVLLLGTSYVFGMVVPLLTISLLWNRYDWGSSRLFRPRSFHWKIGPIQRTITGTSLATSSLLGGMGAVALWIGLTQESMPSADGWASGVSLLLQRYGRIVTEALAWIPNWVVAVVLLAALALAVTKSLSQLEGNSKSNRKRRGK